MNMNKIFLSFLLGGIINSAVVCMDYNIVDPTVDRNKPTSFLGMMALSRKKQMIEEQKESFEKNGHILSRSFSVDSFDRVLSREHVPTTREIIRNNKCLKWNKNSYYFGKNSSQSFFLDVTAAGFSKPLISPTSVDKGVSSPTTKLKGILKQSACKK